MAVIHEPTVSLFLLNGLVGAAERAGASRADLLRCAELREDELSAPDVRISRARFLRACTVALELSGNAALGLAWAARLMPRSFGPVSQGLAYASTLRQALQLLMRFESFFTNSASFQLIERADEASIRLAGSHETPLPVRRMLTEMSISWFVKVVRSIRPDATLLRLDFTFEAPPYQEEYAKLFGAPARFAQSSSALTLARSWLDVPSAHTEASASWSAAPTRPSGRPTCAQQLYQLIVERVPDRVSMPEACRALGIGERSLRRRLADEGRSFKEIEFKALAEVPSSSCTMSSERSRKWPSRWAFLVRARSIVRSSAGPESPRATFRRERRPPARANTSSAPTALQPTSCGHTRGFSSNRVAGSAALLHEDVRAQRWQPAWCDRAKGFPSRVRSRTKG